MQPTYNCTSSRVTCTYDHVIDTCEAEWKSCVNGKKVESKK